MALRLVLLISCVCFVLAVTIASNEENVRTENNNEQGDNSADIIKRADAEESTNFEKEHKRRSRFIQPGDVKCPTPGQVINGSEHNISGIPYTMNSVLRLDCDPGFQFSDGSTSRNLTCLPTPHPCMCLGIWEPQTRFPVVCKEIGINIQEDESNDSKAPSVLDDELRCYKPNITNGTVTSVYGTPYQIYNQEKLKCNPGFKMADGSEEVLIQCTPLPVIPNAVAWIPSISDPVVCSEPVEIKDDLQCYKPNITNGTVTLVSGKPGEYGRKMKLQCFPGLKMPNGLEEMVVQCIGMSVIPPRVQWYPSIDQMVVCSEPVEIYDGLQCYKPNITNGTVTLISGKLGEYGRKMKLQCFPGLKMPNGLEEMIVQCLGLPVVPPTVEWIPEIDSMIVCAAQHPPSSADPKCPHPKILNGTLSLVSGKWDEYGSKELLQCDPRLKMQDGNTKLLIQCMALPVHPPAVIWNPQIPAIVKCTAGRRIRDEYGVEDMHIQDECPPANITNGTTIKFSGKPNHINSTEELRCYPGLVMPDGKERLEIQCILTTFPKRSIYWVPKIPAMVNCSDPISDNHVDNENVPVEESPVDEAFKAASVDGTSVLEITEETYPLLTDSVVNQVMQQVDDTKAEFEEEEESDDNTEGPEIVAKEEMEEAQVPEEMPNEAEPELEDITKENEDTPEKAQEDLDEHKELSKLSDEIESKDEELNIDESESSETVETPTEEFEDVVEPENRQEEGEEMEEEEEEHDEGKYASTEEFEEFESDENAELKSDPTNFSFDSNLNEKQLEIEPLISPIELQEPDYIEGESKVNNYIEEESQTLPEEEEEMMQEKGEEEIKANDAEEEIEASEDAEVEEELPIPEEEELDSWEELHETGAENNEYEEVGRPYDEEELEEEENDRKEIVLDDVDEEQEIDVAGENDVEAPEFILNIKLHEDRYKDPVESQEPINYPESSLPHICLLPAQTGNCRARKMRFFFDATTNECREFVYGGCGANENNFKTLEECRNSCR